MPDSPTGAARTWASCKACGEWAADSIGTEWHGWCPVRLGEHGERVFWPVVPASQVEALQAEVDKREGTLSLAMDAVAEWSTMSEEGARTLWPSPLGYVEHVLGTTGAHYYVQGHADIVAEHRALQAEVERLREAMDLAAHQIEGDAPMMGHVRANPAYTLRAALSPQPEERSK